MRHHAAGLLTRAREGDLAALGRLITLVVADPEALSTLIVPGPTGAVGITGPPGVGKSSLIAALIGRLRAADRRVGVLCVDPSSPFSGGAVLGDRIRMGEHARDGAVFIRSFAARGELGGLARGIPAATALLEALGYAPVLIETVGVGQSETAIRGRCRTTVLVLSPATGDSIQAIKSGVIEIAHVIAVNKADLPGARETALDLRRNVTADATGWTPAVVPVSATGDEGIGKLWEAVEAHRAHVGSQPPQVRERRRPRAAFQFPDTEHHTLPFILRRRAEQRPDTPFLSWCGGTPATFGEIDEASDRLAAGLRRLGVGRGDRVALVLPNCPEFVPLWFAIAKLGAIEVPVNPDLKGRLLEHVLDNCGARVLVCHTTRLENLASARRAVTATALVTVGPDPAAGGELGIDRRLSFDELGEEAAGAIDVPIHFSDTMAILYTSGTTGMAKGVLVSHEHAYVFAELTASNLGMTPEDAYFSPLPLFHIDAQVFGTFLPLIYGTRGTLQERFSASRYLDQVRASGSTVTNMLGSMAHILWKQPPTEADADHPLRVAQSIPMVDFKAAFEERFGLSLVTGYGQTETSLVTYDTPGRGREGSCGQVAPGFEVAVVDEHDRRVPPGTAGEIVLRGEHPFWTSSGYFQMPDATAQALRNFWFHTGDAGHFDEDGWMYFDGRIKDAIRRRGENVSAAELESVINEHPAVVESAAIAVPSELGEDDIKVLVVPRNGTELAAHDVLVHCEKELPWFMVPRYIELRRNPLPRTPSEKVAKAQLREEGVGAAWDREAHGYAVRRPPSG